MILLIALEKILQLQHLGVELVQHINFTLEVHYKQIQHLIH